jgi:hypothetical protein
LASTGLLPDQVDKPTGNGAEEPRGIAQYQAFRRGFEDVSLSLSLAAAALFMLSRVCASLSAKSLLTVAAWCLAAACWHPRWLS